MSSELIQNCTVPAGFEIVIGNADVEMGKIWNMWFNVTGSDDPGKWDAEILAINSMQGRLGGLSDEHRLIRAHMAEFCRYHPSFPSSIDVLCDEIGNSGIEAPPGLGCEGRGLLQSLGYPKKADIDHEVRAHLGAIATALRQWRHRKEPKTARDRQAAFFLAEPTESKTAFVDRLLSVLGLGNDSILALRELAEGQCRHVLGDIDKRGRPLNCFGCLPANEARPLCQCSYAMLACAGILCADRSSPENPPGRVFLTWVQEHILVYASALNSWLSGDRPRVPPALPRLGSLSGTDATDISRGVHECLGEKSPEKTWLVASLLKTIVGNQRWHKRRELIDDCPEVTRSLHFLAAR